jgi:hypothetical protein
MRYKTKRKQGTYDHFCILILAQSPWKETDKERIKNISLNKRKEVRDHDYHFYHRLTYRDKQPEYSLCLLCNQIYKLFIDLKKDRDFILYQGHHYIEPDDFDDLLEFSKLLIDDEKVKKIYVLYVDSLVEFKTEDINKMFYDDFKALIYDRKCTIKAFESILDNQQFKERVLYEILKERYY